MVCSYGAGEREGEGEGTKIHLSVGPLTESWKKACYSLEGDPIEQSSIGYDSEGAAGEMLPVPLAADLRLPRLGDVVRHAEREVAIVLDGDELHWDVSAAHAHLQKATPTCIAGVHGEAARVLQTLDEAL